MAGIKNIRDLYKKVGEKGLREVLEGEIRVTEKFDAYRFAFEKNPHDYKIYFYGKNGKAPLSKIDRTVNDLYEQAISYIENLPADIKKGIPPRHRFGFSWFPNNKPLNTEYDRRPKNGLILTDITVRNRQWDVTNEVKDNKIFERWSGIFGVESNMPVFEGCLDSETVDSLIRMAKHEYELVSLNESSVYTSGKLNTQSNNIEALVIESGSELFKIADTAVEERRVEKRSHLFDILLLDICEHLNSMNLDDHKPVALQPDEAYIELVSEVFNEFVDRRGRDFLDSDLERPKFLDKSGLFNGKWVKNPKTRAIIESNGKYEYLFTVFLTNLRKPKYPSGLLSEMVVNEFNSKIEEINSIISDDYSFLEFNTILREADDSAKPKKEVDFEKSVLLLQAFFGAPRKTPKGKEDVNVIICDCSKLNNSVIREAERLQKLNGHRCFIIHDVFSANRDYVLELSTVKKILSKFIEDHHDLFIGYKVLSHPLVSNVYKVLSQDFNPCSITYFERDKNFVKLEQASMRAMFGDDVPEVDITYGPSKSFKKFIEAVEKDSYHEFCKEAPECVQRFWTEIKTAYDKQTYYDFVRLPYTT
jgi:hypothetical protein